MASPLSKGLFAHAIGESGGAFPGSRLTFPPLELAAKQDAEYFSSVRSDSSLAALRAAGSADILELANLDQLKPMPGFGNQPRFEPARRADKEQLSLVLLLKCIGNSQRRHDVAARAATGNQHTHVGYSISRVMLSSTPISASMMKSDVPP